ncbi:hypothetical protein PPTG_03011 [Phytophthora nicotianae INRA-310]|uniref:M96 mating-specific protein family n=1 Tax=Phytophthora nicotianae (strain INRA-310) TaxID=761204 RepID=W2R5V3_PHYN3|nr:hypothetical protein PPTG_03011 [Phytophthora nicotianae INRA-310]ETN19885.1 hypothetical protein PPTG_03011 [Phytophthora nicotianae INRA-310]
MSEDTETLEAVFSFLSQIDLPSGFEDEASRLEISHEDEVTLDALCGEELPIRDQLTPATTPVKNSIKVSDDEASNGSPVSSEDSVQPTQSKEKPKRVRISRKQQIDTLREEVQELNEQLQSLLPQVQPGSASHMHNGQLVPRRVSMWEEIAARQLERREKSEEENAKLREMLQIQIHEARNLRRVLKRRTKIEMMEDMLGMKRQKMLDYDVPDDNPQVFEDMLRDTDELYVGVEALFHEKRLYDLPCPGRRRDAKRNVTNGLFLELLQRHAVPFDMATTEKAVWKAMRLIIFQGLTKVHEFSPRVQFHAHHVEESSNTLKTSFFVEAADLGDVKGAQLRKVVRKYVENDRVVFICKNLMEPILHDKGKTSGFSSRTTLRIVIRSDDSTDSGLGQTSRIDSHFSATRHNQGLSISRDVTSPANMDVGIEAWDEAISRIAHQVESLAIDESCTKVSSSLSAVR